MPTYTGITGNTTNDLSGSQVGRAIKFSSPTSYKKARIVITKTVNLYAGLCEVEFKNGSTKISPVTAITNKNSDGVHPASHIVDGAIGSGWSPYELSTSESPAIVMFTLPPTPFDTVVIWQMFDNWFNVGTNTRMVDWCIQFSNDDTAGVADALTSTKWLNVKMTNVGWPTGVFTNGSDEPTPSTTTSAQFFTGGL